MPASTFCGCSCRETLSYVCLICPFGPMRRVLWSAISHVFLSYSRLPKDSYRDCTVLVGLQSELQTFSRDRLR